MLVPRVDWAAVMADLKERGITPYKVSVMLNVADCTSRNWANGGEPGYTIAVAVLRLHTKYCGELLTISRCKEVERMPKVA